MDDLLGRLNAALDETERIASFALRYRKFYLESGQLETWAARRDVNNHTAPYHDWWVVEAHLGELEPKVVLRLDALTGEFMARSFAATGAPFVLHQIATHRKVLEFTNVLRADNRDNDADYLVELLAKAYGVVNE